MNAISRPVAGFQRGAIFTVFLVCVSCLRFDPSRFDTKISIEPFSASAELNASCPLGDIVGDVVVALKCVPPTRPPSPDRTTILGIPDLKLTYAKYRPSGENC